MFIRKYKPYYCPLCYRVQNRYENKFRSYCEKYGIVVKMKPLKFEN